MEHDHNYNNDNDDDDRDPLSAARGIINAFLITFIFIGLLVFFMSGCVRSHDDGMGNTRTLSACVGTIVKDGSCQKK